VSTLVPTTPVQLRSAFPTKTVLFLLVLGGLAYYFVEVQEEGWTDNVLLSYHEDQSHSTPLHFNGNKEDLDHYIQYHILDPVASLKDPGVARFLSEQFDKLAFGWMMTRDDAQRDNMPITHGCRFRSNEPCEDFFSLGTSPGPGANPWNYWSIMDGHAGRQCANYLQWTLIPYVSSALLNLPASSSSPEIDTTIKETFLRIDKGLMDGARTAANWFPAANAAAVAALAPAFSGSCALLAAFDPKSDTLRVACTGDSRAVLGRWDPSSGSYTSIPLSVDQTGFNEKEVARLAAEHPDEPDMIDPKTGRLLGLMVTRAFGDHRWKWDNDFVKAMQCKFWGTKPRPGNKTPPYLTAEPEITETEVVRRESDAGRSDFMIMASDGLWDRISSEHAVECVERWLEAKRRGGGSVANDPRLKSNPPFFPSTYTLDKGVEFDIEKGQDVDWKATPEFFAIEDENAAVCLARNALGGTRRGLFTGVLSVATPLVRSVVDDTTIMVVFFDKLDEQPGAKKTEEKKKTSWWKPW
jgi:pyruvate dehydrogenase phosphatase